MVDDILHAKYHPGATRRLARLRGMCPLSSFGFRGRVGLLDISFRGAAVTLAIDIPRVTDTTTGQWVLESAWIL